MDDPRSASTISSATRTSSRRAARVSNRATSEAPRYASVPVTTADHPACNASSSSDTST